MDVAKLTVSSDAVRFKQFARHCQAVGCGATEMMFQRLLAAYRQPHRHYHTVEHIDKCLAWLDWSWSLAERPHEIAIAIWYHDLVYEPLRRDNEAMSAASARHELEAGGADPAAARRIEALVLATAAHDAQQGDAGLLVDIDLSILGALATDFADFERAVRAEYAMFDDATYAKGRARVLASLAAREPLYVTPLIASELADNARTNLTHAIAHWQSVAGSR